MQVSRIYSPTSDTIPFIENCIQICLSEDGSCTDFVENLSVNSLKQTVSIDTTFYNPPIFSLHNTVKDIYTRTLYSTDKPNLAVVKSAGEIVIGKDFT
jgi:hypothetical protein